MNHSRSYSETLHQPQTKSSLRAKGRSEPTVTIIVLWSFPRPGLVGRTGRAPPAGGAALQTRPRGPPAARRGWLLATAPPGLLGGGRGMHLSLWPAGGMLRGLVPGSLQARRHLRPGRSWLLKPKFLHAMLGERSLPCPAPPPRPSAGGTGRGGPPVLRHSPRESQAVLGLRGAQSSSSSLGGAAGGLSCTLKHSTKKLMMAWYRCCLRGALWK